MPAERQLRRTTLLYFGFQFFFGLLFWLPVFYEYQKRIGLSDVEIFRIQSIYYVAFCLLEIPTGMIADQVGRRRCMRAGAAVLAFSNLLPILAPGYSGFLWHFLLIALARSFISGASSAYLYDLLARHDATEDFKLVEGRSRAYSLYGKVACWSVVGVLMNWHMTIPYWLTVGAAALSLAFAMALPAVETEDAGRLSLATSARSLLDVGRWFATRPFLAVVVLQGVAAFVLGRIVQVNLFQPILGQKGFSVETYGVVMGLMTAFEAVGSGHPGWVRRWLDDFRAVFALSILMAVLMGLMAPAGTMMTLALLAAFAYVMGLVYPIQRQLVNDAIPDSRHRATIMSLESIVDRAVNAWLAALIGGYLSRGAHGEYLLVSGTATVGFMLALWALSAFGPFRRAHAESPGPR